MKTADGGRQRADGRSLLRGGMAALASGVMLAAACSSGPANAKSSEQSATHVEEIGDSSLIAPPRPELFPLVPVEQRQIADRVASTCVVSPDVNRTVPVNALGGGRVTELKARLGDHVERGQTLVVISSPDLSGAIQGYEHAVADDGLARKQLERSKVLFERGSIARKDLEAAEDAAEKAAVDLRTTAMQVRMLGGDVDHPSALIELKAPISGTIVQQAVAPAAGVKSPDNAPNLFTIADLSTVWMLCDVYENDLSRVHADAAASVRLNAYPERLFHGRVSNISPLLDSTTRTVKVRVELNNADGVMRVGMFGSVEVVSPAAQSRLLVPAGALLRLHDADWVFVRVGTSRFRRTRVVAGSTTDDGWQQVLSGLARGDSVVRDALQFSQATARE
jgi:cobalt-zinc-cadmium efflux system membrane fusion protein